MSWTAKISPSEMAFSMCNDILRKFLQINAVEEVRRKNFLSGIVDGLSGHVIQHPYDHLPPILENMYPDYVVGHSVGTTWAKIAREWQATEPKPLPTLLEHMHGLGSGSVGDSIIAYLSSPDCSPHTRSRVCSFFHQENKDNKAS